MFRSGLDRTPSTTTFDMTRKVIIIICKPHIRIVNCMLPQNEPDSNHVSFSSHLCRLKWMVVRCATVCLSITRRSIRVVNLVSFDSRTEIVGNIRGELNYILTYHHISKISVLSCWHSWIFTLTVVNLVLYALQSEAITIMVFLYLWKFNYKNIWRELFRRHQEKTDETNKI